MMSILEQLPTIITLFAIFFAWLIAQLSKVDRRKKVDIVQLFSLSGGTISSHSASVAALVTAIWLWHGFSLLFVFALLFAAIVIKDALAIRYAVGQNAVVLHKLTKDKKLQRDIKIVHGHTPKEVVYGVVLGFASAVFFFVLIFAVI